MDLIDNLQAIANRIEKQRPLLSTEEATKNALVMPVINALGYNVFDPSEVVPEFTADVGTKKGEKVDYALVINGVPMVLIECKTVGSQLSINHASQLFRYFATTSARFAILTNGISYQFYTDIDVPNRMDEKPFFEFSMNLLDSAVVTELKKFSKSQFDLERILSNASELKYLKQIKRLIHEEIDNPSDELTRHFGRQVYSGMFTSTVKEQFTQIVANAFRGVIKDRVNERIQSALDNNGTPSSTPTQTVSEAEEPEAATSASDDGIVTTDEEREAFYIVKGILAKHVHPSRVAMRDTKSYCGVLLDDNNRKPICRLRFNRIQKYLSLFDDDKVESRHPIEEPVDIYNYESQLVASVERYDQPKAASN